MFNQKQFEKKIYALVTQEVNEVFSTLLKTDRSTIQTEGIKIQREVMQVLHSIIEETVTQILCGLLLNKKL